MTDTETLNNGTIVIVFNFSLPCYIISVSKVLSEGELLENGLVVTIVSIKVKAIISRVLQGGFRRI